MIREDRDKPGSPGIPWRFAVIVGAFVLLAGITVMAVIGESEQRRRVYALEREVVVERARVIEAQQLLDHFIDSLEAHKRALMKQATTIAQLKRGVKE
jgi:hypothetical protein